MMLLLILEKGRGKHRCEKQRDRETSIGFLPYLPRPGIEPATWVCALTGNQTQDLLVHRMTLQPNGSYWPKHEAIF